jgi:hypothetical protein
MRTHVSYVSTGIRSDWHSVHTQLLQKFAVINAQHAGVEKILSHGIGSASSLGMLLMLAVSKLTLCT